MNDIQPSPVPGVQPSPAPQPAPQPNPSPTPQPSPGPQSIAGGNVGDQPQVVHAAFPETWRQDFAGEDKADLKTLENMANPKSIWDAYKALRTQVSSGQLKSQSPFPDKGTPEQQSAWRKEHNIPEKADAYPEPKLPNGVVLGEADKPLVKSFTDMAHSRNWTAEERDAAVGWYYAEQDRMNAAREQADAGFHDESLGTLHQAMGKEFQRNMTAYSNFADQFLGEDLRAEIEAARLPNGRLLGDDPRFVAKFAKVGMEIFPTSTLLPAGGNAPQALETRQAELKKLMGDQSSDYWKGPKAEGLQQEYRDIVSTLDRQRARAKA